MNKVCAFGTVAFCMRVDLILHRLCSILFCHATKPSKRAWFLWVSVVLASPLIQVKHVGPAVVWYLAVLLQHSAALQAVAESSPSIMPSMCTSVWRRRVVMRCRSPHGLYLLSYQIIFIWPPYWHSFWEQKAFFFLLFFFLMRSFKRFVEIVRCFSFKGPSKGIAIDFRLRTVALLARCDPRV